MKYFSSLACGKLNATVAMCPYVRHNPILDRRGSRLHASANTVATREMLDRGSRPPAQSGHCSRCNYSSSSELSALFVSGASVESVVPGFKLLNFSFPRKAIGNTPCWRASAIPITR